MLALQGLFLAGKGGGPTIRTGEWLDTMGDKVEFASAVWRIAKQRVTQAKPRNAYPSLRFFDIMSALSIGAKNSRCAASRDETSARVPDTFRLPENKSDAIRFH
jgi:hypothetical protein